MGGLVLVLGLTLRLLQVRLFLADLVSESCCGRNLLWCLIN